MENKEKKTHEHVPVPIDLYDKLKKVASKKGQAPQRYLWGLIEGDYLKWKKEDNE
ncbi:hypothetical protein OAK75_05500 [Bacteriovoracales bacterium]|nr:hypothetical protein [Bacteriovoracales bacterium]